MLCKEAVFIIGISMLKLAYSDNSTFTSTEPSYTTTPEPNYVIPIYTLQYNITEENSVNLIFKLLTEEPLNTVINRPDLLNLLDSKNLAVARNLIDIEFEELINIANISTNELLRTLTGHVPARKVTNIMKILDGFSIDYAEYIEYVIEDDDLGMLELLSGGVYTNETIRNALIVMNQTEEQILSIITPIFLNELAELPLEIILYYFEEEIKDLFFGTNITINDITRFESFNETYQNFIKTLNNETFWASAISNNELVTISEAFLKVQRFNNLLTTHVTNIENNTIHHQGAMRLNNSFSIITVNETLQSFFMINYVPNKYDICYYLMQENLENLSIHRLENITFNDNVIAVNKTSDSLHSLGSPLICEDYLCALLITYNDTSLKFLNFKSDSNSGKPTTESSESSHYQSSIQRLCKNSILIVLSVILYMFL